jgi:hypothetical protein
MRSKLFVANIHSFHPNYISCLFASHSGLDYTTFMNYESSTIYVVITSYNPPTGLRVSLSLQNRIIGSHSALEAGIPSLFPTMLDSVTEEKAL